MLSAHLSKPLPKAPAEFDNGVGVALQLDGNGPDPMVTNQGPNFQGAGNCGYVGAKNGEATTQAVIVGDSAIDVALRNTIAAIEMPTPNEVVAEYFGYTKGQDTGVVLTELLEFWRTHGLFGRKILAWATINTHDEEEFYDATYAFDFTYNGIAVAAPMQEQFAAGEVLDLTGTIADYQIEGGHCVSVPARCKLYTWGQEVAYTERWRRRYMEESHIVITEEVGEARCNGLGIDLDRLIQVLDGLKAAA